MIKKVFLDPGHGGNDIGFASIDSIYEKDINLEVCLKIQSLLNDQDVLVKLSRCTDDDISLVSRVNLANSWGADCFVSIHCNSFNKGAYGIQTTTLNKEKSALANCIHSQILCTKAFSINRGIKYADPFILANTTMSSSLIELGFLDNEKDKKILIEKKDELALGIARGICRFLNIEYIEDIEDEVKNYEALKKNTYYKVVLGTYDDLSTAQKKMSQLKKLGFIDAYISAQE
ncbi:MAG: N-acetylmuramoyl-L-alanine amidase [Romboutsia sp.]|uniref:N-acetylmuramoyl-L-alanine amidase n=1 Tax=Romboutsia sp. TaxID=1965302 RepID=UPI003F320C0E